MEDAISETKACDLLARLFKARGYAVTRNVMFREYGVEFHADGWDPRARVGFEFLSSEDDDHDDLTLAEYQTLMAAQKRGELSLFVIDEVEPLTAVDLVRSATDFLDEVTAAKVGRTTRKPTAARKAAKKKAAKPAVNRAAKPAAKKVATKKVVKKKANARPVAKKRKTARRSRRA